MKSSHVKMEYSMITPYIYIGTNMCCGVHFQKLFKLGIKADIDLEETRSDREGPEKMKFFLWLPTEDHTSPIQDQLLFGARAIETLVTKKIMTYVHC
jgi:hypothetical protein